MKKLLLLSWTLILVLISCKKNDTAPQTNSDSILSESTIVVTSDVINSSLISVDSNKLTFTASGNGVDKVKLGSILVSDISSVAPNGFLRKVTGISTINGNKVCITEQASLTDAIVKGKLTHSRAFTDSDIVGEDSSGIDISAQQRVESLSLTFAYSKILYDRDGNNSTTYDQIKIEGEMKLEPTLYFELDIDRGRVNKFVVKLNIKNTNRVNAEVKALLPVFNTEIVLKTFRFRPFTILVAGVPVPIAKQWIAIVIGIDGSITAKVTGGAQNINTAVAGISYENSSWSTINTIENSFSFTPPVFEGALKVEPWLQARYEIRPYGIKESRIYVGVRGSVIAEATANPSGINSTLKWGLKFNAKAQMQIWNRSVLDFEQIFFEREFPIYQASTFAFPTLTTTSISSITQSTAQSGGTISSDGGAPVTARGICYNTSPNPTTSNIKTVDGSGVGSFTSSLAGLTGNTTYYLRAYATNSVGTGYGDEISFTTHLNDPLPTVRILWAFDDCSPNDLSGNNFHGTFQQPPPICQNGVHLNSVCFQNPLFFQPQGFISPSNLGISTTASTVSFWAKFSLPTIFSPLAYLGFFMMHGPSVTLNLWSHYDINNPSQSYWSVESSPSGSTPYYSNPNWAELTNGEWHHFAFSFSNNTVSFYKDGTLLSTFGLPGLVLNTIVLEPTPQHNVCFDQVRVYGTSLSGAQIQAIYNNHL